MDINVIYFKSVWICNPCIPAVFLSYAFVCIKSRNTYIYINYIHIELLNVQLYLVHLLTVLAGSFNYTYMLK